MGKKVSDPDGIRRDMMRRAQVDRDGLNHASDALHNASRTHGTEPIVDGYRPEGAREPGDPRGNISR